MRLSVSLLLAAQIATITTGTTVVITSQPSPDPSPPPRVHDALRVPPSPFPMTLGGGQVRRHHAGRTVHRPSPEPVRRHVPTPRPTRLQAALARLPGYRPDEQRWVFQPQDHWGVTDPYRRIVYLSTSIPRRRFFAVVAHEWGHIRSVLAYGGDARLMRRELNAFYGGTGWDGAEKAADCIARLVGASWTQYTSCTNPTWRAAARRLLHEQPI
jgi:hypothetical protein